MAKLVSLPEIIQNIYVKLEESGQGGSGTGGNCSSNITIDTSTNKGTLNVSDGSVLSTQVLNVEDTPKAGRVTLTDKDSNSISFDAVTVQYLGENFYTKSVVDDKLSALVLDSYDDTQIQSEITSIKSQLQTISSQGYDDTELKNRVTVLENKVLNMVTYADLAEASLSELNIYYTVSISEDAQDINQELSKYLRGSPTTTLTVDDLNFVEYQRQETENENYEKIVFIDYEAIVNTDITFKDGSSINNTEIHFYKRIEENLGSEYVYLPLENGVKIQRTNPNIPAYVDTGLKKSGNYRFIADGYTTEGKVSVLIGSYDSNTDRTTARILGTSNKLQSMWSANNEITNAESGIDFNSKFRYIQKANSIDIDQSDKQTFTKTFTNQNTSQTTNTPIYLFNESTTSDYDHGVLYCASIIMNDNHNNDYNKNLKYFIPCKDTRTNEIVLINVADYQPYEEQINKYSYLQYLKTGNIPEDKIYRPTNGILVEVQ